MKSMRIFLLILLSTAVAKADTTQWYDYEEGMSAAAAMQKPVLLDFYADWCPPCIAMEEGTYPDPRVVSEMKDYIAIKVDTQNRIDIESKYGITYYPTIVFLDSRGKEISRHIGYLGPDEMVAEIKQSRQKLPREAPGFEMLYLLFALLCAGALIRRSTMRLSDVRKVKTTESAMNPRFVDEHEKASVTEFFIPEHGELRDFSDRH